MARSGVDGCVEKMSGTEGAEPFFSFDASRSKKLAKPLEEAVFILATKIEETGESLRKGYNFKHGVSRFVDKDD